MALIQVREVEFRIVIRRIFGIGETLHCRNVNNIAKIMIYTVSTKKNYNTVYVAITLANNVGF